MIVKDSQELVEIKVLFVHRGMIFAGSQLADERVYKWFRKHSQGCTFHHRNACRHIKNFLLVSLQLARALKEVKTDLY